MKMAKASETDLAMAIELAQALDSLTNRWTPMMPEAIDQGGEEENERFDIDDAAQCRRVMEYLLALANRASLFRVVFGMQVLLDPHNELVDQDANTLEAHPKFAQCAEQRDALLAALKRVNEMCCYATEEAPQTRLAVLQEIGQGVRAAIAKAEGSE